MILSLFPKGVSMASKAMDPTTTNDMCIVLFSAAKLRFLLLSKLRYAKRAKPIRNRLIIKKLTKMGFYFKIIPILKN